MKRVDIVLSEKDLEYGKPGKGCECPVARCINRQLLDGFRAFVGEYTIIIYAEEVGPNNSPYWIHTNPLIHGFIRRFDHSMSFPTGIPIQPGYLTSIELPEEILA